MHLCGFRRFVAFLRLCKPLLESESTVRRMVDDGARNCRVAIHWWTNRPTQMVEALAAFREAVLEKRLSFTPADDRTGKTAELSTTLRRHIGNARERPSRSGLQIGKEQMSTVLAWTARAAAIAAGVKPEAPKQLYIAKRIR